MVGKNFQKRKETFTCVSCGAVVKGTGYTDHCPKCLTSIHVDVNPGDRASKCRGLMLPKHAVYLNGNYVITYQCLKCGKAHRVTAAPEDDQDLLDQLSQRSMH